MDLPLFSIAYLPNINFFQYLIKYDKILIEQFETFPKQTYRNRCEIYGANGKLCFTIPTVKIHNKKIETKDVEIEYVMGWQKNHWKSIESAYNSSPFFEFYRDYFEPFYLKKEKFLIDFNLSLLETILLLLKVNINISKTKDYSKKGYELDFRCLSIAKQKNAGLDFNSKQYMQVFSEKHGFVHNLSIIDLLFNEGPNSLNMLL